MSLNTQPAEEVLEFSLRTMLAAVIQSPWWTNELDPAARLEKLGACASSFAQAASIAYPENSKLAWICAGDAASKQAVSDALIFAHFQHDTPYRGNDSEFGPRLSLDGSRLLIKRMAAGCANVEQRNGLIDGVSRKAAMQKTLKHSALLQGGGDAWITLVQESSERLKIIEESLPQKQYEAVFKVAQKKFISKSSEIFQSALSQPIGDAFFQAQSNLSLKAQSMIAAGQAQEGLATALAVAQHSALSKDPLARPAFDTALKVVEAFMQARTPPQTDADVKEIRRLLNDSRSFWIGALDQDSDLEAPATIFLKVALSQASAKTSIKETQNERAARLFNEEALKWSWSRAECGPNPSSDDFKRFSSRSGLELSLHAKETLLLFSGFKHAAYTVLSEILTGMQGDSFDKEKTILALLEMDKWGPQSQAGDYAEAEALRKACEEGLRRLSNHLLTAGQGEKWRRFNDELKTTGCSLSSSGNDISLSRVMALGEPVDKIALALRSGKINETPSFLMELAGNLTESKERLVALLEAQELGESMTKRSHPKPRPTASL